MHPCMYIYINYFNDFYKFVILFEIFPLLIEEYKKYNLKKVPTINSQGREEKPRSSWFLYIKLRIG